MRPRDTFLAALGCLLLPWSAGQANPDEPQTVKENLLRLKNLPLEALMETEVSSVSKKNQRLSEAAAAVFVITQEDIHRSGATSVPEALRMAPGIHVARIDANKWAISIRGFNERFSNKLLVLVDGRSVYSPLFSGVYWDEQDMMLEDVERIEIIRGPGAALWGANAVNGVINIISKTAKATQGGLASGGFGSEEKGFGALRYGGRLSDTAQYRVYAKRFNRGNSFSAEPGGVRDASDMASGGFRVDWQASQHNDVSVQGRYYDGLSGQTAMAPVYAPPWKVALNDRVSTSGGHVLGRWRYTTEQNSESILQSYFDRTQRADQILGQQTLETTDIQYQYRFAWLDSQEITWGINYRSADNRLQKGLETQLVPEHRRVSLYSGFLRDEIKLSEKWKFIAGTEVQHNDFTGFEVQPTARLLWLPMEQHTFWTSVSRAVRTPAIEDQNLKFTPSVVPATPIPIPVQIRLSGNNQFISENVMAYEAGYRFTPNNVFSLDTTAFYNFYDNLRTFEQGTPFLATGLPFHVVMPFAFENQMKATSHGAEISGQWKVTDNWRLSANYHFVSMRMLLGNESIDRFTLDRILGHPPQQQFSIRSLWDINRDWKLDLWARYVDQMRWEPSTAPPPAGLAAPQLINAYITLDARLAWEPVKDVELSLVGQNLLDNHHPEFIDGSTQLRPVQIERSGYIRAEWRF